MDGVSYESLLHIQVQEASRFSVFLSQITPGSEHPLPLLAELAENVTLAVPEAPPLQFHHAGSRAHKSREMGKRCLLARVVGTVVVTGSFSLLHDLPVIGEAPGLGGGGGGGLCHSWLRSRRMCFPASSSHGQLTLPLPKALAAPTSVRGWAQVPRAPLPWCLGIFPVLESPSSLF